ncbi:MAG: UTP--glucose-1-phosphate uridylyltransferase GalU [Betaproteobacteria bacterium]|jgi:UTP--glucose-1-phosphate uridylyltransferase|nr:UTP--glucose-1-phosphate uridylyltransferase GalU [Betaproteobacteria bacterium]
MASIPNQAVRKAVFPVAGLGTRFLPATKASPKEMLPVVDKPLIQYAVEEAAAAGITEMIFITGRSKRAIEDHFDKAVELEAELAAKNKHELLRVVQSVAPDSIHCIYIRQPEPLGLGHAVLCAQPVIGDEPFAVILADDLMDTGEGGLPVMAQMTALYAEHRASVIAVQDVPRDETSKYGIVASQPWGRRTERVVSIVEKPKPADAPSTLAVTGRYLLSPRIFGILEQQTPGAGGEIQLTDAIAKLLDDEPVLAYRYEGTRFDCGSKQGYLRATVTLAMRHAQEGTDFQAWLRQHLAER